MDDHSTRQREAMNNLYVFGKLYWILKNTGKKKDPVISTGFMRQTAPPWFTGTGIQLRAGKYLLQVGVCGNPQKLDDKDGLLYAMQGRVMDIEVEQIGEW